MSGHRVVLTLLCLSSLSARTLAQPSPKDVQRQLEQIGMVPWRADVTFHSEFHNLTTSVSGPGGGSKQETTETLDVTATIVQYGDPPAAAELNVETDPKVYVTRNVTGHEAGLQTQETHDPVTSTQDEWKDESAQPDPTLTTLNFHYRPSKTGADRFGIQFDTGAQVKVHHHFVINSSNTGTRSGDSDDRATRNRSLDANAATPGLHLDKKGSTYTIDGTVVLDNVDENKPDGHTIQTEKVTVHIVIRPDRTPQYEAVIRPAKQTDYDLWIPQGPAIPTGKDDKGGNSLALVVEIHDMKTGKVAPIRYTPTYSIESSHAPGWCMDFPAQKAANERPDLFFDASLNRAPVHKVAGDGSQLTGITLMGTDKIVVSSRDYGAYGRVHARLQLDDGSELLASYTGPGGAKEEGLLVPEDTNGNHVADQWEKDQGIFGKGYPGTWDDEQDPPGMANGGDGYDLYEEYRGFYLFTPDGKSKGVGKPSYVRLDPKRRELLFRLEGDSTGVLYRGAMDYSGVTGIQARFVTSNDQLAHLDSDGDDAHPRWSKFDAHPDAEDFGPRQAAIWIRSLSGNGPIAQSRPILPWGKNDDTMNSDDSAKQHYVPMKVMWVTAWPASATSSIQYWAKDVPVLLGWDSADTSLSKLANWSAMTELSALHPEWKLSVASTQAYVTAHLPQLTSELVEMAIIHELGHATGAQHHDPDSGGGEATCPMRYWHFGDDKARIRFLSGHWDPAGESPYGPWLFCPVNWPTMKLHD